MRGFTGIGIYTPKTASNVGGLWRSAHAFGADFIFTVGARHPSHCRMDVSRATRHIPLFEWETFEEFVGNLPRHSKLVGVEYPGTRKLAGYTHPHQAVYLLGAEDHGLPSEVLDVCDSVVEIDACSICLNVATAGGIILYDRAAKGAAA